MIVTDENATVFWIFECDDKGFLLRLIDIPVSAQTLEERCIISELILSRNMLTGPSVTWKQERCRPSSCRAIRSVYLHFSSCVP